MNVDSSRITVIRATPDRLEQILSREDAPRFPGENTRELELHVGELGRSPVYLDPAPSPVEA